MDCLVIPRNPLLWQSLLRNERYRALGMYSTSPQGRGTLLYLHTYRLVAYSGWYASTSALPVHVTSTDTCICIPLSHTDEYADIIHIALMPSIDINL